MNKRMQIFKRFLVVLTIMTMMVTPQVTAFAAGAECIAINGGNENAQNYSRWASPIDSYLSYDGNQTLMKVQAAYDYEGVLVEYYDMNYRLLSNRTIPQELPIFGGFYATASNYYLVTGQTNLEESPDVECFRITKYDKNWNRITSVGLFDCNTTVPFDAGSLRFAECGKYLLIRTAHEMYTSSDGLNHQANVTIQVDTDNMIITDSYTRVMNSSVGYVSHSFNQFIEIDNNKIVSLDHGDAYPRSLVLLEYPTDVTTGTFQPDYFDNPCKLTNVISFPGAIGANSTGASAGGLEIAKDYYLVAGNSVIQDQDNLSRSTRNVFVAAVSKATGEVTTRWFSAYAEGEEGASTPHFVKLSDNEYMLLWTRAEKVYYTKVDATGMQISDVYSMNAGLSDCNPIVVNGKLIWYIWNNEKITFYEIQISNPRLQSSSEVITGHTYENSGTSNGYAQLQCTKCQKSSNVKVAESVTVWWNTDGGYSYSSGVDSRLNLNQTLYYWCNLWECDTEAYGVDIESSDTSVIDVSPINITDGKLIVKKAGTSVVTFTPKYNPDAKKTYTFTVDEEGVTPVTDISLGESDMSLYIGEKAEIFFYVYPSDATNKNVNWVSSNTSVATVDSNGLITAVGAGEAVITVTPQDGGTASDTCRITVRGNVDPIPVDFGWSVANGRSYWYENGIRQGTYEDPKGVLGDGTVRGREIYDSESDGWYWLDAVYEGAKAVNKEVWMPYIYQNEDDWNQEEIAMNALASGSMAQQVINEIHNNTGKWVRYDADGKMYKGWYTVQGDDAYIYPDQIGNTYYYDYQTGLMAKGWVEISGITYHFDEITGVLQE